MLFHTEAIEPDEREEKGGFLSGLNPSQLLCLRVLCALCEE
jgi:hypothetical protein